jgi:hypothetical protein
VSRRPARCPIVAARFATITGFRSGSSITDVPMGIESVAPATYDSVESGSSSDEA